VKRPTRKVKQKPGMGFCSLCWRQTPKTAVNSDLTEQANYIAMF